MYLRGIQFPEMESIMQFIYLGEATFYEERMDEFLAVAKSLEIKELCNAETEQSDEPDDEPSSFDQVTSTEYLEEPTVKSDQCDYQATHQSNLTKHIQSKHEGVKYACDQCDYRGTQQGSLTVHIRSKHGGVKYACNQCGYHGTTHGHLRTHIKKKHEV